MPAIDGLELLLVEDSDDDARYVHRSLVEFRSVEERLVEVETVHRADRLEAAYEYLDRNPDVVLLDLGLPDSDGLETLDAVVEHAPHLPIVVITGQRDAALGPAAIRRGAQDYLRKGNITDDVLHRTIRYAIDRHETQREVVELNHRLSALARIVRQDVRDDMNMIVGRGSELADREGVDAEVATSLLEAAYHALELTDRVGELVAVLSGDRDIALEPVDLDDVLDARVSRLRERHEVSIVIDRDAVAPGSATVLATPSLGSALEELLTNAIHHNDKEVPCVSVTVSSTDGYVSVAIADDGIGMPYAQRELLNDPRARFHERSRIGTGLYLALSIVERIDGDVEFADNHPEGTVVTVDLQRASSGDSTT